MRMFSTRSALVNIMIKAAFKASKGLVHDFGEVENLQVSRKGPGDFVSVADRRSEKIIYEELSKANLGYGFLMEESGEEEGEEEGQWIIDPLDGTTNFLHGLPYFCISIALAKGQEILAGIVYDPLRDELFWAAKGIGAYLNDRRITVSSRHQLADALVSAGVPYPSTPQPQNFFQPLQDIFPLVAGVRSLGSAALELAYVAAGRLDAFWEDGLWPWDMAAGALLVKEAKGHVKNYSGTENFLERGTILATNTHLYKNLSKIFIPQK